jgi:hypothetical protein
MKASTKAADALAKGLVKPEGELTQDEIIFIKQFVRILKLVGK